MVHRGTGSRGVQFELDNNRKESLPSLIAVILLILRVLVNCVCHLGRLTVKQFPPIAPFAQHFFPTAIILKQPLDEALVDIPLAFGGMSSFGKRSFPIEARSAERTITLTHAKES